MKRMTAFLVLLALLGACSGEGSDDTTTSTALATTTTIAATTTTTPPATTTTQPTPTTTVDPRAPGGSGCSPGTAVLPDGEWFGVVDSYDETGISFDLACWFTGDGAIAAAAEDGEESPPPNDYYVRNENEELRFLAVDEAAPVVWYPTGDPNDSVSGTFAEWIVFLDGQDFRNAVWVTISSGMVTAIEEQWVP